MTEQNQDKRRGRAKRIVAGLGLAALLVGAPTTASAVSYSIGATNNGYNAYINHGHPRWHGGGSGMSFRLDSHTYFCGSAFSIRMRDFNWASTGWLNYTSFTQKSFLWNNGGLNIPANSYYVSTHNYCSGGSDLGYYNWSGLLNMG